MMPDTWALLSRPSNQIPREPEAYSSNPTSPLAQELETLSRCWIDSINDGTWRNPDHEILMRISPGFTANFDHFKPAQSFREHLDHMQEEFVEYPSYHAKLSELMIDAREAYGWAVAYLLVEITGRPDGVRRQNMIVNRWRKEDNGWLWHRMEGLRGSVVLGCAKQDANPGEGAVGGEFTIRAMSS